MKVEKKVISHLNKCYSCAADHTAARCFLSPRRERTPATSSPRTASSWRPSTEPAASLTMAQVPGLDGQFLGHPPFYSPNDSKDAKNHHCHPQRKRTTAKSVPSAPPLRQPLGICTGTALNTCWLLPESRTRVQGGLAVPRRLLRRRLPEDLIRV